MVVQEFSNQFDLLVSSYRRFRDFDDKESLDTIEFDEYEKSLFLTKAQQELVISLYNGRNLTGNGFEETEELRRYLSNIIEEAELSPITTTTGIPLGIDSKSKFFTLPENLLFITYEAVTVEGSKCENENTLMVVPCRQDEYSRLRKNPFRGPNDRRALRFDLSEGNIEIVSKYPVSKYYLRYLRKVRPVVLVDLPPELSIEGISEVTECELHEALHQRLLEIAVTMALQSKGYSRNNENK